MADYPLILDQLDRGAPERVVAVGGGCIAQAAVATWPDGFGVFVKRAAQHPEMFVREAEGLEALAQANAIRVPRVLAVSQDSLVLELIQPGARSDRFFEAFGRQFARLHQQRGVVCGFGHDNFIGSTPQMNQPIGSNRGETGEGHGQDWPEFFVQRRLRYQVELAHSNGHGSELQTMLDRAQHTIIDLLGAALEPPSLLHGDLWSGNYLADESGAPCLIDPAVYFGHREADLAMTALFGGFDASFYAAYHEALPLAAGWRARLPIYQLYHLLNHLNLFGSSYYGRCHAILGTVAPK